MIRVHQSPDHRPQAETRLPLDMRIRLGHAVIQNLAEQHNVSLLHIKGYAVEAGLYSTCRTSSDIDVLVRPEHVDEFVTALLAKKWRTVTGFASGSIFQHAMTLWHDSWGYLDVHRWFPGAEISPSEVFEELWRSKTSRFIAGIPCTIPAVNHQTLLIVLHAARDPYRGAGDVLHLRETLTPQDWDALDSEAKRFGASLAFAAATGGLAEFADDPKQEMWAVVSEGGSRINLLVARARAAETVRARAALLVTAAFTNPDHLRMTLQREPRFMDYTKDLCERFVAFWSILKVRRSK